MSINATDFGELKATVKNIEEIVDKFDRVLYGNGKDGLIQIILRMESKIDQVASEQIKTNELNNIRNKQVNDLETKVNDHIQNEPRKTLFKHWKTILFVFVILFVFLHSILPSGLTVYSLIEKIF